MKTKAIHAVALFGALPAPNGTFSLYIRAYWPDKAVIDGTWQPPAIEKVK